MEEGKRPGGQDFQNYKEAFKSYRMAAEEGIAVAQTNLGLMYDNGLGVEQDYVQAHKWYNIAGTNGDETGRKSKDDVEKQMNPDQIKEAQKLAREWMEEHGKE
jgi:TPR repeat protein